LLGRGRRQLWSKAAELLAQATEVVAALERARPVQTFEAAWGAPKGSAAAVFSEAMSRLLGRVDGNRSRADFACAIYLRSLGFEASEITAAMLEVSPDLALRKKGREQEYVRRTVERAIAEADRRRIVNAR